MNHVLGLFGFYIFRVSAVAMSAVVPNFARGIQRFNVKLIEQPICFAYIDKPCQCVFVGLMLPFLLIANDFEHAFVGLSSRVERSLPSNFV